MHALRNANARSETRTASAQPPNEYRKCDLFCFRLDLTAFGTILKIGIAERIIAIAVCDTTETFGKVGKALLDCLRDVSRCEGDAGSLSYFRNGAGSVGGFELLVIGECSEQSVLNTKVVALAIHFGFFRTSQRTMVESPRPAASMALSGENVRVQQGGRPDQTGPGLTPASP
jgi:hypothetical protein